MHKRMISRFLIFALLLALLPHISPSAHAESYSGTFNDSITWTLDTETGLLVFEGSGTLGASISYNASGEDLPSLPSDLIPQVKAISIPEGITRIYYGTFSDYTALTAVNLPEGLQSIGSWAFYNCSALTAVSLPEGLQSIGSEAFYNCSALAEVNLPESLQTISSYAFLNCPALTGVSIPGGVTNIRTNAFGWLQDTNWQFTKVDGFTIYGYEGTAAQTYAEENGFTFVPLVSVPVITEQPASVDAPLGEAVTFTVAATGYNLSYQWQYKKPSALSWTNWSGKKEASVSVKASNANNGYQYRCIVSSGTASVSSEAATLNVYIPFAITSQPVSARVAVGKTATFSLVVSGENLSYQWQYLKPNASTWVGWPGKTEASASVKAAGSKDGFQYRCVVSNGVETIISDVVSLTVISLPKPTISTQPASVQVALGETASFTVVASGEGLSYQWQYKKPGSSTWTNWSGKTAATATVKATNANNGYQYRCVVRNEAGSVNSEPATLTLASGSAPTITTQPASVEVALGETASFTVVASGEGLSYQWQYKKPSSSTWTSWSGKTSASVTVKASNANNAYQYRCVVKNDVGSVSSAAATLTVIAPADNTVPVNP